MCGPGSLQSWELAGFISVSSHSSLLSFPLFQFSGSPRAAGFPKAPQHLWNPGYPWCPPASSAARREDKGTGQYFLKLPSIFLATLHLSLSGPVPPSSSLPGRSLEELCGPRAIIPCSSLALRFSAEVARS